MPRLTNDIRETIAGAAIRRRYYEQAVTLLNEFAALANDVYCDIFRKADRERMEALPKGWLPETDFIGAQFGGDSSSYQSLYFEPTRYCPFPNYVGIERNERKHRRVPNKHMGRCVKVYAQDHRLSARWTELREQLEALKTEISNTRTQLDAALQSVTTTKALLTAWPEIAPFVPAANSSAKVPAIRKKELNTILDLPVSEAA